jgi:hypothetical protein
MSAQYGALVLGSWSIRPACREFCHVSLEAYVARNRPLVVAETGHGGILQLLAVVVVVVVVVVVLVAIQTIGLTMLFASSCPFRRPKRRAFGMSSCKQPWMRSLLATYPLDIDRYTASTRA